MTVDYTVIEVAGAYAVAHRQTWTRDLGPTWESLKGARWIVAGPFGTLIEAEAARDKLTLRTQ